MTRSLAILTALLAVLAAVWVFTAPTPSILIENATARVRDGMVEIGFTVRNDGPPDRLRGASSEISENVALIAPDSGEAGAPIPARHNAIFSADGASLRMAKTGEGMPEGQLIPVTLDFERAGELAFKARVTPPEMGMYHSVATIHRVDDGEPVPGLSLAVEPSSENGWTVTVEIRNFRFAKDLVDGPHVPGTGHAHLYVGSVKLGRLYEAVAHVPSLPPGRHTVRVTLNTNDHRAYAVGDSPVTATAEIVSE